MSSTPSKPSPTGAEYSPTEPSPKTPVPFAGRPRLDPFTASPTFSTPPTAMNRTILNKAAIAPAQAMTSSYRDRGYVSGVYPPTGSRFYRHQRSPTPPPSPVGGAGSRTQTRQFGSSYARSPLRQAGNASAAALRGTFHAPPPKVEGLRGQNSRMARPVPPGMPTAVQVAAKVFSPSSAAELFQGPPGARPFGVPTSSRRPRVAVSAAPVGFRALPAPRIADAYQPPKGMFQARVGRWAAREDEKVERLDRVLRWREEQGEGGDEEEEEEKNEKEEKEEKDDDEILFTGRRNMRRLQGKK